MKGQRSGWARYVVRFGPGATVARSPSSTAEYCPVVERNVSFDGPSRLGRRFAVRSVPAAWEVAGWFPLTGLRPCVRFGSEKTVRPCFAGYVCLRWSSITRWEFYD